MGEGIIGKFIYVWLCICLAVTYVGWQFIRSRLKRNAAARKPEPTPRRNNRHGKKKR